jgi:hypothetical protein
MSDQELKDICNTRDRLKVRARIWEHAKDGGIDARSCRKLLFLHRWPRARVGSLRPEFLDSLVNETCCLLLPLLQVSLLMIVAYTVRSCTLSACSVKGKVSTYQRRSASQWRACDRQI